jgi:hypothetical protein
VQGSGLPVRWIGEKEAKELTIQMIQISKSLKKSLKNLSDFIKKVPWGGPTN